MKIKRLLWLVIVYERQHQRLPRTMGWSHWQAPTQPPPGSTQVGVGYWANKWWLPPKTALTEGRLMGCSHNEPPKCYWPKKRVSQIGQTRNINGICSYCILDKPVFQQIKLLHHQELTPWWSFLSADGAHHMKPHSSAHLAPPFNSPEAYYSVNIKWLCLLNMSYGWWCH